MAEIVVTEFMDEAALSEALPGRDVFYSPDLVDRPEDLLAALGDCRGLIVRNRTQVTASLMDHAPALKVVGRLGVGLDNIDLEACAARGVAVRPAVGANDLAVAEYVIAASMILRRRAFHASDAVAAGGWPRMAMIGREFAGSRLGLVGFGAIARLTASRALALGAVVSAYDPLLPHDHPAWGQVERLSLEEVLARADIVSLHTPLTAQTRGMIDARALARVKSDAVLINAARGGILDEGALCEALKQGRLAGAALDVFESEPLSREAGLAFEGAPNLILTPHIAGVTEESNVRVSRVVALAVAEALRG